jgi:Rad3-related DNA helicase
LASNPARIVLVQEGRGLDVGAPHRDADPDAAPRGVLLVDARVPPDRLLQHDLDGGWRLHPWLFWSLVRPRLAAGPDPERSLAEAWHGLERWAELEAPEIEAMRGLCERHTRGAGELITILERRAAIGPPAGRPVADRSPRSVAAEWPSTPEALAEYVVDPDGFGRAYGASFTPRQEQAELATGILRALGDGQALLAEAGTGTGKTLAYLLPLLAWLSSGDERAVISTYSRTLQQQILREDLPRLVGTADPDLARLLMGRGNYLCLRQRTAYLTRPLDGGRDALKTLAFRAWLQETTEGMREELAHHPLLAEDLPGLFASTQPCTPHCHVGERCFVARARRLARRARLVVVNHALLLHDHAAGGALIGPYEQLVVDEAQRLPGAALDARSVGLYRGRLRELEDLIGEASAADALPDVVALLSKRLEDLQEDPDVVAAARAFGKASGRAQRGYGRWWRSIAALLAPGEEARPGQRQRVADKEAAFAPLREETLHQLAAIAEAASTAATLARRTEDLDEPPDDVADLLLRCAQAGESWRRLERDVRFVTADPSDRWVTWIDPSPSGAVGVLGATPLESGPLLRELWQDHQLAPVATSATLAVGGDFGFMLEELGLSGRHPRCGTLSVPSPFAWREQALALAPEHMPDPDSPQFAAAVAEILRDLRRTIPRQTLVLFTSYRLLQDVATRLVDGAAPDAGPLLVQSPETGIDTLRARFRDGRRTMLLGTSTFWEGVDFPGESLEIVVVTKLPFQVPSDPWVEARCERLRQLGENPFAAFMLRDAVLRLRQGAGRLLRRQGDRGVILLLDNRLITRQYGATFRDALPTSVRWVTAPGQLAPAVQEFLTAADP